MTKAYLRRIGLVVMQGNKCVFFGINTLLPILHEDECLEDTPSKYIESWKAKSITAGVSIWSLADMPTRGKTTHRTQAALSKKT